MFTNKSKRITRNKLTKTHVPENQCHLKKQISLQNKWVKVKESNGLPSLQNLQNLYGRKIMFQRVLRIRY